MTAVTLRRVVPCKGRTRYYPRDYSERLARSTQYDFPTVEIRTWWR